MSQAGRAFLKLMNRDSSRVSIDEDRISQAREIQKERHMSNKEKNPKQVLIDWVNNVNFVASTGDNFIQTNNGFSKEDKLKEAANYFNQIMGQCEAMMTVLKNSD